ncbi:MAG: sigma-70 family RNA polymerase sigma factor [Bacteroidales bacterium]|nr:sigma-70 family RNA polymerase sigma factor [Bacteroidales bacterium]
MTREEFKVLFDRYFDSVRSYLFYRGADREQASDLAQDVFLRIWEKQLDVDPKTALRLLYKMAGDMFVSRYRRETLETNYRVSLKNDSLDFSPEDQLQYNELLANYKKALAALSEKQRTVFLMARLEGLKYHEIAERLNLSVKAVEKRMSITLAYLKKALQE